MASQRSFVKFCYNSQAVQTSSLIKSLEESDGVKRQVDSFSEYALVIDPKNENFGQVIKSNFAFVPTVTLAGELEIIQGVMGMEQSLDVEDFVTNLKDKISDLNNSEENGQKVKIEILEKTQNSVYIVVNPEAIGDTTPSDLIKEVIELTSGDLESNYSKYFVNNCLIVDALKAFGGEKVKQEEARRSLYEFIDKQVAEKKIKKSEGQKYEESFDFRPFFGEGVSKLPKLEKDTGRWDWDEIYINPGMDSETFKQ